jgi:hypothetical protein
MKSKKTLHLYTSREMYQAAKNLQVHFCKVISSHAYTHNTPQRPQLNSFCNLSTNIVVKKLTLLLRIRENPGSNLSLESSYSDWGFSWLFSVPPGKCQDITLKLSHNHLLPHPFHLIHYSFIVLSFNVIQYVLLKKRH